MCNKCNDNEYQCYYGTCLDKNKYCDGVANCANGTNEPQLYIILGQNV